MNLSLLSEAVSTFQADFERAITTSTVHGTPYDHGRQAKEALIRSGRLIQYLHEAVKRSLAEQLAAIGRGHEVHPPLGRAAPELKISGLIKAKDQDVVVLVDGDEPRPERVTAGPLAGTTDPVGRAISERAIVIGVRSQMSSVAKNFDTLMERAFAETLNLRLRLPRLVMGDVYLLPVREYDDQKMLRGQVSFKRGFVPVERFIRTFGSISGREDLEGTLYKYERTALVLVDFAESPPRIFEAGAELGQLGISDPATQREFDRLSPRGFAEDVVRFHSLRHPRRAR